MFSISTAQTARGAASAVDRIQTLSLCTDTENSHRNLVPRAGKGASCCCSMPRLKLCSTHAPPPSLSFSDGWANFAFVNCRAVSFWLPFAVSALFVHCARGIQTLVGPAGITLVQSSAEREVMLFFTLPIGHGGRPVDGGILSDSRVAHPLHRLSSGSSHSSTKQQQPTQGSTQAISLHSHLIFFSFRFSSLVFCVTNSL